MAKRIKKKMEKKTNKVNTKARNVYLHFDVDI